MRVPHHIDEYLPDLDRPLQADQEITAGLPRDDAREQLAVRYAAVAGAVADAAGRAPVR
jgi:hypothetical protein